VAIVLAESLEDAREGARRVRVGYAPADHKTGFDPGDDDAYAPEKVNAGFPTDTDDGDVEAALTDAAVVVDQTYTTPTEHNNPMEPHATVALWRDTGAPTLLVHDSTQGVHPVRKTLAGLFGLDPDEVRVVSPYVGGGFGSKGLPHPPTVLAALAARAAPGREVKLTLTRQQMFDIAGYRTPTSQRIRLAARPDGHLTALVHDAVSQTARIKEFAEQTAVASRTMYAADSRRTTHRVVPLDVPVPSWMRAPGEAPGMFGLEVALDELAGATGLDPIELRRRNEPGLDPESGKPYTSRRLLDCFDLGAERFGWAGRDATPGRRRQGDWLVGTGVAAATYPGFVMPGSRARIEHTAGCYDVFIGAADIGTGTWTALAQVAADALGVGYDDVRLHLGDTSLPMASVEGGSAGIASWGSTVVAAARAFRDEHGTSPADGARTEAGMPEEVASPEHVVHSFGAHFAEVRVHAGTGEVRVPRMLGVFSCGRIVNPRTARSQFVGGMTMGLSMALHEHSVRDPRYGHVVTRDLAEYHVAAHADVQDLQALWLDESDPLANPMGTRGIGEIGIVGAAAAIANATHHATGVRVRELPLTPDRFLDRGPEAPVSRRR
jgi:xanthine dehydrogenase YagR molybdenum-binding subunit